MKFRPQYNENPDERFLIEEFIPTGQPDLPYDHPAHSQAWKDWEILTSAKIDGLQRIRAPFLTEKHTSLMVIDVDFKIDKESHAGCLRGENCGCNNIIYVGCPSSIKVAVEIIPEKIVSDEKIICAAIWYKELNKMSEKWIPETAGFICPSNIDRGIVICGYRHPSCLYTMVAITGKRSVITECGKSVQGFLTSKNRFVDRKEGAKIFVESGGKLNYSTKDLYSEDLY